MTSVCTWHQRPTRPADVARHLSQVVGEVFVLGSERTTLSALATLSDPCALCVQVDRGLELCAFEMS